MKYSFIILFFLISKIDSQAQHSLRASMGIDFANIPSLNDYLNQSGLTGGNSVKDFNSAVNFSGEFDYSLNNNLQLGFEIAYLLNSFNFSTDLGKFELDYNFISPSVLSYYVLGGGGYNFKFGGGIGIRFVSVDVSLPGTTAVTKYSSTGYGAILRSEGNTLLGGNFYANIGADLKYDIGGNPKSNGSSLYNNISRENVNLNSLAFAVRLGISYIF